MIIVARSHEKSLSWRRPLCALIGLGVLAIGCSKSESTPATAKVAGSAVPAEEPDPNRGRAGSVTAMPPLAEQEGHGRAAASAAARNNAPTSAWGREFDTLGIVGGKADKGGGAAANGPGAVAPWGQGQGSAQRVIPLNPNARYATTYRPGGAALAAFDAAVTRGSIPASYKDLVGDFGARYAPKMNAPTEGALAIAVDTERTQAAPGGGDMNLRVAIRSSEQTPARAPLSVHLVLDVSGSMSGVAIDNARKAAETLVGRLDPSDDFSLVTFSSEASVLVPDGPVGVRKDQILQKIRTVKADGGTNISAGLDLGYKQAHTANIHADAVKIVMLLSDGHANAGVTAPEQLAERSSSAFQDGIQTSTFGLGTDFDAPLMSGIADRGAGGYYYLESSEQIASALTRELDSRLVPVAQAVEVRVRLRPDVAPIKVFGSRELGAREAFAVRQQEVAVDQQVQKKDGIKRDRDTDAEGGMRFFMPAFARDDRHAMLLTLKLPPGAGERPIASVEVRFKDRLLKKNVTREIPVKIRFAADDAASAATADPGMTRTIQAFAAGDAVAQAAALVDVGDRRGASRLLAERAELLRAASTRLSEPALAEDATRFARLAEAVDGAAKVNDAVPLAVLLRGSAYGYLR